MLSFYKVTVQQTTPTTPPKQTLTYKPFVIGRKNWLFSNTASGANSSANLYSVIESAKANGLEPRHYIEHLLTELPKRKASDDVKDLLPWTIKLGVVH